MDPDAPLNVARGTVITSVTSALLYSVYGTVKHEFIGPLASSAALNSGIVAATFFSIREYAVSPLLLTCIPGGQFARRREQIEAAQSKLPKSISPSPRLSWNEMRLEKLPDTAISGALAGSIFNYWKRGRPGIVPGTLSATVFCSFLQLGYNELRIWRVRYVSKEIANPSQPREPARALWERTLRLFGMRKMSDEEYLQKMKEKREQALHRIAELEAQQAEEPTERPDDQEKSP